MYDVEQSTRFERKSLDIILREAFLQGVRHGAGYAEFAAIPEWETEIQFRAFKDDLHGNTWSPQDWYDARQAAMTQPHRSGGLCSNPDCGRSKGHGGVCD